ncbi:glutamate--cysteine ligase [Ignatzschineria sp. RMDPL8A]|uniref:glutamate--cysteine ligase n=1 Tax=Ignatzschineria sp. RMDPL8A TaxID=2999236 RepID=UPI0024467593|nr:glutamate--cysteine ligase [Ignatzschineria sp. RMDPL8A]MDG9730537.1 glutamate--cysteine ligase [Ignatzschineria sp. RMDPL8A]
MFTQLNQSLNDTLSKLGAARSLLSRVNIGLERETLRIDEKSGRLSSTPHPKAIGSALTHSNITTDFAEMMLEFVTDPHDSVEETLLSLEKIQEFTYRRLNGELFWPNSMPPAIESDDEIIIGYYGESNEGKMKHTYRVGLSHRYGKMMQAISGIHYNFSFKDEFFIALQKALGNTQTLNQFKTERYLNLARNIARVGFVVPYFIGASPLMCKSFLRDKPNKFDDFNEVDSYVKSGTSLRLSDIGYGNNKCHFDVSLNDLNSFVKNIYYAITTPCKDFSKIEIKKEGKYQQINNHILQIENEYYSSIRPKQIMKKGESFIEALNNRGIEYVELRSIDINPLVSTGIDLPAMKFLQALLTACLLTDAAPLDQKEYEQTQRNLKLVAENGKRDDFHLTIANEVFELPDALQKVIDWMRPICEQLENGFSDALSHFEKMIENPKLTPSSIILEKIQASGLTYQEYFFKVAHQHYSENMEFKVSDAEMALFDEKATASLEKLAAIEAEPQIPFDEFLDNYFDISL